MASAHHRKWSNTVRCMSFLTEGTFVARGPGAIPGAGRFDQLVTL
jgi:hypothetical protein